MSERWIVTGALGCIGAWVVRLLVDEGCDVHTLDLAEDGARLQLVVGHERLAHVRRHAVDIRSLDDVLRVVTDTGATHVVHLAALQIPFVRADPTLGTEVNVVGTVNVFEAARSAGVRGLAYSSSAAAYDSLDSTSEGRHGDLSGVPATLYGVHKRANEGTAHVYGQEHGVASIGLRPHTVYGVGRDQGVTSSPTQAILAAARGEEFRIVFGGIVPMQYVADVAGDFIAAARAATPESPVVNLPGSLVHVADIVEAIGEVLPDSRGRITFDPTPLPFPGDLPLNADAVPLAPRTPLVEGVRRTVDHFREGGLA